MPNTTIRTKTKVEKKVNVAGKSRAVRSPYASWTDPNINAKYLLLKSWQVDNGQPLARWMVYATGPFAEMGDMYVSELVGNAVEADDLAFDSAVWPTRADFISWARGSK